MGRFLFVLIGLLCLPASVFADDLFPVGPNARLTPGSLCARADEYRYPEHIAYCNRHVGGATKQKIVETYDSLFGYKVAALKRNRYKIDHYIPLCMGGSNETDNLWPQHESVFAITDPLEQIACEKMAAGKLKQADAIKIVRHAKANLKEVSKMLVTLRTR